MTLLEMQVRPIDRVAVRDRDWPTAPAQSTFTAPPTASAPPIADTPVQHRSVLTMVTVAVRNGGAAGDGEPEEELEEYEELAAARFRLEPLPRLGDLELTVVQTDSDGGIRRWTGPGAAGAGIPTGPGAVLHLQPAASHHAAAVERSLAIQADRDRRPSREGFVASRR